MSIMTKKDLEAAMSHRDEILEHKKAKAPILPAGRAAAVSKGNANGVRGIVLPKEDVGTSCSDAAASDTSSMDDPPEQASGRSQTSGTAIKPQTNHEINESSSDISDAALKKATGRSQNSQTAIRPNTKRNGVVAKAIPAKAITLEGDDDDDDSYLRITLEGGTSEDEALINISERRAALTSKAGISDMGKSKITSKHPSGPATVVHRASSASVIEDWEFVHGVIPAGDDESGNQERKSPFLSSITPKRELADLQSSCGILINFHECER
jgi:hypothetical protein